MADNAAAVDSKPPPAAEATPGAALEAADGSGAAAHNGPPVQSRRCIFLTGYGGLKHVKVVTKEEEGPGPGQVKIRVKAW